MNNNKEEVRTTDLLLVKSTSKQAGELEQINKHIEALKGFGIEVVNTSLTPRQPENASVDFVKVKFPGSQNGVVDSNKVLLVTGDGKEIAGQVSLNLKADFNSAMEVTVKLNPCGVIIG